MLSSPLVRVIDDDRAVRDSLEFLLRSAGFGVELFDSAEAFLAAPSPPPLGCVLTDIRMGGLDGLELMARLREASSKVPVIVMTGHGDVPLAVKAMKLGAVDFVEKPFDAEALIAAVQAALESGAAGSTPATVPTPSPELASRLASLSQREQQVLQGLLEGRTNKEIARAFDLSPRTVEVYRAKLMTKMQAANISELVRFAIKAGLSPS
jgi:two-component system response regulator FixJ